MNVSKLSKVAFRSIIRTNLVTENYQKLGLNSRKLHQFRPRELQLRQVSTIKTHLEKEDSFARKILRKIPFLNIDKTRLMAASYLAYENIADKINYINFFDELELNDTFYSWFVITELHIWMLSVRFMAEGEQGRFMRNYLTEALWNDVSQRIKKLGESSNASVAREQVQELSEQLQAALIAYDEGLQSDDTILAGALWRRFYQQEDIDPRCLEILVKYVRKQVRLMDHLSIDSVIKMDWIPLNTNL